MAQIFRKSLSETGVASLCGNLNRQGYGRQRRCLIVFRLEVTESAHFFEAEIMQRADFAGLPEHGARRKKKSGIST